MFEKNEKKSYQKFTLMETQLQIDLVHSNLDIFLGNGNSEFFKKFNDLNSEVTLSILRILDNKFEELHLDTDLAL